MEGGGGKLILLAKSVNGQQPSPVWERKWRSKIYFADKIFGTDSS